MDGFSLACIHWCYFCQSLLPLHGCVYKKKRAVWSNATVLYPKKSVHRNKTGSTVHTASHFDIRIEPWRQNAEHREETCWRTIPSWQLGNLKLGHRTKHLIKAPICNCGILFLLFLCCLCVCSHSLNRRRFLICKLLGELLMRQIRGILIQVCCKSLEI